MHTREDAARRLNTTLMSVGSCRWHHLLPSVSLRLTDARTPFAPPARACPQGELLDQIEYTVSQSVNYTSKAVEELRSANKYQRSYRKKMCCMVGILLILLLVIIIPVLQTRRRDT